MSSLKTLFHGTCVWTREGVSEEGDIEKSQFVSFFVSKPISAASTMSVEHTIARRKIPVVCSGMVFYPWIR